MNFDALRKRIDALVENGVPEAQLIVRKDGKEVFRHIAGYSDAAKQRIARYDDLFWLFSMTKVYTMTAALRLVERGLIDLDEPVGTYLPEFKSLKVQDGDGTVDLTSPLTVRCLMSMTGGFNYDFNRYPEMQELIKNKNASTVEVVNAFSKRPLLFQPGSKYCYGFGHDIVAAVVEVVSGKKFRDFVKDELLDPIGITDMGFHPTPEQQSRIADKWRVEYREDGSKPITLGPKINWLRLTDNYDSGGAGLFGNAEQYIKMVDALANGGIAENGYRVLKPETIDLMRTNQLTQGVTEEFQRQSPKARNGYGYGLGVRTLLDPKAAESHSAVGEFGWDGAAGSYVLIDPENHVTIVYVEHIMNHGDIYEVHHKALRNLIYQSMGL
ncbi:MAG: beta-lactamase family protein [Clostridia bacterium]|nr:beta-lactamase family protein [Clostridia bacterium]